jgi:nicotinamidase-related amidase
MKTHLLIIDVQDYFATAAKVVDETVREVKLAIRRNASIVIAEFVGCGQTNRKVREALTGYDKAIYVTKYHDGGGSEVLSACKKNGVSPEKFRVVGVNRSWCVYSTVLELFSLSERKKAPMKIEVSKKGTWCGMPQRGLNDLKKKGCTLI